MYLVFDTKTTGLPVNWREGMDLYENWPFLVQLAWVLFDNKGKEMLAEEHIIKPERYTIPYEATKIHGITNEKAIEEGLDIKDVLKIFYKALKQTKYLVAHNLDYDINVYKAACYRAKEKMGVMNKHHICTMLNSTEYCRLPGVIGYKWPKLTELYDKLFQKPLIQTQSSLSNVKATAKCFFELKRIGIITLSEQELDLSIYDKPSSQYVEYSRGYYDDRSWYIQEVRHTGLKEYKVYSGLYEFDVKAKINLQKIRWESQWLIEGEKARARHLKETKKKEAEEKTNEALDYINRIENLLLDSLNVDNTINWKTLYDRSRFNVENAAHKLENDIKTLKHPESPKLKTKPPEPHISDESIKPKHNVFTKVFKSLHRKEEDKARKRYLIALNRWEENVRETNRINKSIQSDYVFQTQKFESDYKTLQEKIEEQHSEWQKKKAAFYQKQKRYNQNIELLQKGFAKKNKKAIESYFTLVLEKSLYPYFVKKNFALTYSLTKKHITVFYVLPLIDDIPNTKSVKYYVTRDEFAKTYFTQNQLLNIYESLVYNMTFKTIHEVFSSDTIDSVKNVSFFGISKSIDRATGQEEAKLLISLSMSKSTYSKIDFKNIGLKECLKSLKGKEAIKQGGFTFSY